MDGLPTLRPVTDADLGFLAEVYASTRLHELAATGWSPAQVGAFLNMQFEAQIRHYRQHYSWERFTVIECDGQAVGRLYVQRTASEIRIVDIALLPTWRHRGLGSYLLEQILAESDSAGLPVTLHVEQGNPAMHWYERLGFERCQQDGIYWLLKRPVS
jgi:ribosomal protein S18 acetylase RimI-like enzyme